MYLLFILWILDFVSYSDKISIYEIIKNSPMDFSSSLIDSLSFLTSKYLMRLEFIPVKDMHPSLFVSPPPDGYSVVPNIIFFNYLYFPINLHTLIIY